MAKKDKKGNAAPTPDEVEALFADVDETGHTNASKARKEHRRRHAKKAAVEVDPLSGDDPSGSSISKVITRTAVGFVVILLAVVVLAQVSCGVARRAGTARLAESADVKNVASALRNGVEWGNGFTQFPEDYSVQEADENTGVIEVTVVDTSSKDELECLSGSQIQAAALSVNALLNPNINQVIYHVNVHVGDDGKFQQSALFGFLKPTGSLRQFATFIWTKSTTTSGSFNFNCMITGLDATAAENLRDKVTKQGGILDAVLGGASTGEAETESAETGAATTGTADGSAPATDAAAGTAEAATTGAAAGSVTLPGTVVAATLAAQG